MGGWWSNRICVYDRDTNSGFDEDLLNGGVYTMHCFEFHPRSFKMNLVHFYH